jgi:hypothetical protein
VSGEFHDEDDPVVRRSEAVRVATRITRICMVAGLLLGWVAGFLTGIQVQ